MKPFQNIYAAGLIGAAALGAFGMRISFPSAQAQVEPWTNAAPKVTSTAPAAPDNEIAKLNKVFTDLAARTSPAVVNIYTKTGIATNRLPRGQGFPEQGGDFDFFFGNPLNGHMRPQEAQALGSGFVLNTDGYIVTNAHVVTMAGHNADEIMVKFIGEDTNKGHLAKIVGVDEGTDVALLKLVEKKADLKVAPLGDSDGLKVGEWVVAIGNPYGHSNTLTQGVVSALGRSLEGARADFVQTSASINPGNSGGPLINLNGEVIGINTAIDPRAQGIGFAIPINSAKSSITQLLAHGKVSHGWMGLAIQDVNEDIAGYMRLKTADGVLVKEVMPNQPAAQAGIEAYDVIKNINGQEIHTARDLLKSVDKLAVGQTADVQVLRDNQTKHLKVQIGEQPAKS